MNLFELQTTIGRGREIVITTGIETGGTGGETTGHGGRSEAPAAGAATGSGTRLPGSGTNPQHPTYGSKVKVCLHLTSAFLHRQ